MNRNTILQDRRVRYFIHILRKVHGHLQRPSTRVLLIIFAFGFAIGFSVSQIYQNQNTAIGITTAVISSGATLLGMFSVFRQYLKDKREEEKTPTLDFTGIKKDSSYNYYLKIEKTKGEGTINECHAFLDTEGDEELHHFTLYWRNKGTATTITVTNLTTFFNAYPSKIPPKNPPPTAVTIELMVSIILYLLYIQRY